MVGVVGRGMMISPDTQLAVHQVVVRARAKSTSGTAAGTLLPVKPATGLTSIIAAAAMMCCAPCALPAADGVDAKVDSALRRRSVEQDRRRTGSTVCDTRNGEEARGAGACETEDQCLQRNHFTAGSCASADRRPVRRRTRQTPACLHQLCSAASRTAPPPAPPSPKEGSEYAKTMAPFRSSRSSMEMSATCA